MIEEQTNAVVKKTIYLKVIEETAIIAVVLSEKLNGYREKGEL